VKENIFLTGFSGTGKSTTGKILAERLGYAFADTDALIEEKTGRSVYAIFREDGEEAFRQIEREILDELCRFDLQVISTGGGIVISKANRTELIANGYVICLEARPETIYVRLLLDSSTSAEKAVRPLLQGDDQFQRIQTLKAERQAFYVEADWTIHTDFLTAEEVAEEIERVMEIIHRRAGKKRLGAHTADASSGSYGMNEMEAPKPEPSVPQLNIKTTNSEYKVLMQAGLLEQIGQLIKKHVPFGGRKVYIVADEASGGLYGEMVFDNLREAGFTPHLRVVPMGEKSKSLIQAAALYDWLLQEKAERKDIVLALGGGVVGDLAGFVAATWLRGMNLVQVPTTLLAMVDSSVGGKTAVNHPQGKNLIGAFYPPHLVVADINTLRTLLERIKASGWAEVIKHTVIPGADPNEIGAHKRFSRLEKNVKELVALQPAITAEILLESVAVKAKVVEEDEREAGLRITLNYGHTFGHALEAATTYDELQHGEGVAIGMHGVALLSHRLGYCDAAFVERQRRLIEAFGLPTKLKCQNPKEVWVKAISAMQLDKKTESGSIRWILPLGIGKVEIRRDIPTTIATEVLMELLEEK
jgi:3-dehydroquinate synthase